jgi:hypothetical protein
LGIRCCRGFYRRGPFALVAGCGGHPVIGGFGLEADDSAVVGVENPVDGGRPGTWGAGFG